MTPEVHYAKTGDVHIAYQTFGKGPNELVLIPGFVSNIEHYWELPEFAAMLRKLGRHARVTMFDKRGTGLSDRVGDLPDMEQRMDDARAVMDAAGIEKAAIMGSSEGGSLATLFAGIHADRCTALVLYGSFARFSDWIPTRQRLDEIYAYIENGWGSGASVPGYAPSRKDDQAFIRWWGKWERLGASPSAATQLMQMNSQIDISDILPSIRVPTLVLHKTEDPTVNIEGGRFLAENIPNATLVELEGPDHPHWADNTRDRIVDLVTRFIKDTGAAIVSGTASEQVLATVLFTDIVDSTARAQEMGDREWHDLLSDHDKTVRRELSRFQGREIKSLGDGFLATFDGPARAIRCAREVVEAVRPLGLEIRAGLHTGEVKLTDKDVSGIAVNIASRITDIANANEILVSRTVKDLVSGSGIALEDFGLHPLKGLEEDWRLFQVAIEH
jgi:class 3 adenylate cyclase